MAMVFASYLLAGDKRSNASLAVAVERTLVRPGETLKGYVELDVTGTFSCSDLSVNFMGVAKSAVQFSEKMQQYDGGVAGQVRGPNRGSCLRIS
jgi:hypothetical protein